MSNPLDDRFGVSDDMLTDDNFVLVEIPEDPNLDTIIDLALSAYKDQMNAMIHVEPKNRLRYMEVCERFLNQAKDAMDKKERLALLREKISNGKKAAPEKKDGVEVTTAQEPAPAGKSREELLATVKQLRGV